MESAFIAGQESASASYPPLFIIGAPRSGSTLLYQLIAYYYECAYFTNVASVFQAAPALITRCTRGLLRPYDDKAFSSDYGLIKGVWAPSEAGAIRRTWFSENKDEVNHQHVRSTVQKMSEIMGGPFIWKNLNLSYHLEVLLNIFPEALFVKIERDLKFTCQSIILSLAKEYVGTIGGLQSDQIKQTDDPLDAIIAEVLALHGAADTFFVNNKVNHVIVKYENLCSNHAQALEKIESIYASTGFQLRRRRGFESLTLNKVESKRLPESMWKRLEESLDSHLNHSARLA